MTRPSLKQRLITSSTADLWLALAVIFLSPLTSEVPRGSPVPFFRLNEVILLVLFGILVLRNVAAGPAGRQALVRVTWLDGIFALFVITGSVIPLLGYLLASNPLILWNIAQYFDLLQFYILYRFLLVAIDDENKIAPCLVAMVASACLIALIGIWEALHLPFLQDWIEMYYVTSHFERIASPVNPRVFSLLAAPQLYASFLVINIILCLTLLLDPNVRLPRRFLTLALVIGVLGLIPSSAYSAMIGAGFMFILLLVLHRHLPRPVWIYGALVLAVGVILFAPQILARLKVQFPEPGHYLPYNVYARLNHWQTAFALLTPSDWLLSFRGELPATLPGVENQYIHFLFRGGILFLVANLYFIVRAASNAYKTYRRSDRILKPLALCTFILLMGFSLMGMTDPYFTSSGPAEGLWTLISLTVAGTYVRKGITANQAHTHAQPVALPTLPASTTPYQSSSQK